MERHLETLDEWMASVRTLRRAELRFLSPASGQQSRRFGGVMMSQALLSAASTLDGGLPVISLQARFLRTASYAEDLDFEVERLQDGRRTSCRAVRVMQRGRLVMICNAAFGEIAGPFAHSEPVPPAPDPETLGEWRLELDRKYPGPVPRTLKPWEMRSSGTESSMPEGMPCRATWVRQREPLPPDPLLHAAAILTVSDTALALTVGLAYGGRPTQSLDHAIWWSKPPRFDDWLLYRSESPAGAGGRAVIFAGFYERDGSRVASVAQECALAS